MAEVFNHDIAGMYRRIQRIIEEFNKSQSSGIVGFNPADLARLQQYIDLLAGYKGWVVGQPVLDLPETHPRKFELENPTDLPDLENESLTDMRRLFEALNTEMINSQSARRSSGLEPFDATRFDDILTKAQAFLTDFIMTQNPVDMPESTPVEQDTGPGRGGINP